MTIKSFSDDLSVHELPHGWQNSFNNFVLWPVQDSFCEVKWLTHHIPLRLFCTYMNINIRIYIRIYIYIILYCFPLLFRITSIFYQWCFIFHLKVWEPRPYVKTRPDHSDRLLHFLYQVLDIKRSPVIVSSKGKSSAVYKARPKEYVIVIVLTSSFRPWCNLLLKRNLLRRGILFIPWCVKSMFCSS